MLKPPDPPPGAVTLRDPGLCDRVTDLIDAWPDGELSSAERTLLDRHTTACPACAADLALAQDLAQSFSRWSRPSCPPQVAATVRAQAETEAAPHPIPLPAHAGRGRHHTPPTPRTRSSWRAVGSPARGERFRGLLRPAVAAGLAASLAAASLVVVLAPEPRPRVSAEEVARAEAELKLTFAYLGRLGGEAGTRVRDEVIENVIHPVRRGLAPPAAGLPAEVRR